MDNDITKVVVGIENLEEYLEWQVFLRYEDYSTFPFILDETPLFTHKCNDTDKFYPRDPTQEPTYQVIKKLQYCLDAG